VRNRAQQAIHFLKLFGLSLGTLKVKDENEQIITCVPQRAITMMEIQVIRDIMGYLKAKAKSGRHSFSARQIWGWR
jgi:hypothetical protein